MTNWKDKLQRLLDANNDRLDVIHLATGDEDTSDSWREASIHDEEMQREFDAGYGIEEGRPFYAWGEKFVYWCSCYDGAEWISCMPRHPENHDAKDTPRHIGGG
jgi:hypothetical protein